MNIAGLVLGIVAWLFALLPIFGPFITIPSAVAGIALSSHFLSARRQKKRQRKQNGRTVALLGLMFAIAALPVMVIRTVSLW